MDDSRTKSKAFLSSMKAVGSKQPRWRGKAKKGTSHTQDMKNFQNSRKGRDRIKTIVLTAIVLILLGLDWAALHDIFEGEPNLYLEYAIVVFSIILISAVVFITLRRKKKTANIA